MASTYHWTYISALFILLAHLMVLQYTQLRICYQTVLNRYHLQKYFLLSSLLMMTYMEDVQAIVEELKILENGKQIDPNFIAAIRKITKELNMKKVKEFVKLHSKE